MQYAQELAYMFLQSVLPIKPWLRTEDFLKEKNNRVDNLYSWFRVIVSRQYIYKASKFFALRNMHLLLRKENVELNLPIQGFH